ncbi:MAG: hypothetical protein U9R72_16750 [Chloroflexota bacterium]|nr:hypothetical protein [Chloroflexota bacterium]
MNEIEKLRVLLPHWIEHNGEHAKEFRRWADRAGKAEEHILAAAELVEKANARLEEAMEELGGPLEHRHGGARHEHHGHP